jgi:hypothetical protein
MKRRVQSVVFCVLVTVLPLLFASPALAEEMPFQTMSYEPSVPPLAVMGQPYAFQFILNHPDPNAVVTSGEIVFITDPTHEPAGSVPITGVDEYVVNSSWDTWAPTTFNWWRCTLEPGVYAWWALVTVNGVTNTGHDTGHFMVRAPVQINGGAKYTRKATVTLNYLPGPRLHYFQVANRLAFPAEPWEAIPDGDKTLAWNLPSSTDGKKTVWMRLIEDPQEPFWTLGSDSIILDTHRPVTYAPYAASGAKGSNIALRYKVTDNLSPKAWVAIKIRKGTSLVKTVTLDYRATGKLLSSSFRCDLARGTYRFSVGAQDLAGNSATRIGTNYLIVR